MEAVYVNMTEWLPCDCLQRTKSPLSHDKREAYGTTYSGFLFLAQAAWAGSGFVSEVFKSNQKNKETFYD